MIPVERRTPIRENADERTVGHQGGGLILHDKADAVSVAAASVTSP